MTGPCFVDANVFVYARDPREAIKQQRAVEWIAFLWRERRARTSVQAIAEFYAVSTRKLGVERDLATSDAESYFEWRPQPVNEELIEQAWDVEQRYKLSWWDSMIVAAAQMQECGILLTEDLQDGAVLGAVRVRNPFRHAVEDLEVPYIAEPVAASLHRRRGRPKRVLTTLR